MGEHALKYVQSRYGLAEDDNLSRMERQKQYINALYEKAGECIENDENFIVESSLKLSDHIISDRSISQLQTLAKKFNEYEFMGIYDIEGESKVGEEFMEFNADVDSLKKLVIETFYEIKK